MTDRLARLQRRFSLADLHETLLAAGLGPEEAERFSARLRQSGLVHAEHFASAFDSHPERKCHAALRAWGGTANAACAALADLIQGSTAIPHASSLGTGLDSQGIPIAGTASPQGSG